MENGTKKGSPIKIIIIVAIIAALLVAGVVAFILMKGSDSKKDSKGKKTSEDIEESDNEYDDEYDDEDEDADEEGDEDGGLDILDMNIPVLGTDLQDYMLWGQHDVVINGEKYDSIDYEDLEYDAFCKEVGMTSISVTNHKSGELSDITCASFPISMEIGRPYLYSYQLLPDMHATGPGTGLDIWGTGYPGQQNLEALKQDYIKTFGEEGIKYYQNFIKYTNTTVAQCILCDEDGRMNYKIFALVKTDGNKVDLVDFQVDNKTAEITEGDTLFSFYVYFDGISMIAKNKHSEIEYLMPEIPSLEDLSICSFAKNKDESYHDIVRIDYISSNGRSTIHFSDGGKAEGIKMEFNENGTFTISWEKVSRPNKDDPRIADITDEPYSFSGEYLLQSYFASNDRLIIKVDGQIYRYQYGYKEYSDSVIDTEEEVSENEVPELVMTQTTINDQLITELAESGIDAETDSKGRIVISTNILFDVDSDEISEEGLAQLEKFFEVYAKVVLPYIENGSVAYVEVGGHTDTDGTYDYNLDLSQRRAEAVSSFALTVQPELGQNMKAQGYSFSDPILNDAGDVDKDASRRVVFKIVLNKQ